MEIQYKRDEWEPTIENSVGSAVEVEVDSAGAYTDGQIEIQQAKIERLTGITGRLLDLLVEKDIFSPEEALAIITDNQGELISAVKESEQ